MSTASFLQSLGMTTLASTLQQQDDGFQSTVDEVYVNDWTTARTHEEATNSLSEKDSADERSIGDWTTTKTSEDAAGFSVGDSTGERSIGDWTTTKTYDETMRFRGEDSDVRHTTQSYLPQQTEQFAGEITLELARNGDTALQPTSTTTSTRMSTTLLSSNFETRLPTAGQQETFIPLVDVSAFDLDRSHPCFKILESSTGEKASLARAFQLCAAVSGLL